LACREFGGRITAASSLAAKPVFLPVHHAKEIDLSCKNEEDLRRRMTVERNAFSGFKRLLTDGKGIAAVFAFYLPGQVSACYVEALAFSGRYLANSFACRNVL